MTTRIDVLLDTVRAGRDPFDVFPWVYAPYYDDEGEDMNLGRIYAVEVDASDERLLAQWLDPKLGALICQLVNLAAAERYGTAVPGARPC